MASALRVETSRSTNFELARRQRSFCYIARRRSNPIHLQTGALPIRAVCFDSIERVSARNVEDPKILDQGDAIIELSMAGLCGSDLHVFFGRESGIDQHTVMGHELVGTVVDRGSEVSNFNNGDRVFAPFTTNCGVCFYCERGLTARCEVGQLFGWVEKELGLHGCQSQFVRVPLANATLKAAPAGLSDEAALLLSDNFSTGYYCAEMADITANGVYAVIGCGNVGQLAIVAAKSMGANTVVAIDPVEHRREAALERGATVAVGPKQALQEILQRSDGRGADSVMELVGLPDAQRLAYALVRPGGNMSVVGCHCTEHFAFSPVDAFDKNLTYRTGRCSARNYMDKLTPLVADGEFDLDPFVTHYFKFDECEKAYDVFSKHRDGCVKAVFVNE